VLALLGSVLPRKTRITSERIRLVVQRPVVGRLPGDLWLFLAGAVAAYGLVAFLISREWVLVGLAALILLRTAWSVRRSRTFRTVVVDLKQDRITEGTRALGQASKLVAVQLGPAEPTTVLLVFRDPARDGDLTQDRGVVLGAADGAEARTIGTAIARYLNVPIVEAP
jgi:hypothetical protein